MVKVYGIPNCDTIKKTLDWLKQHKVAHVLHDYKKEGISKEKLNEWFSQRDWNELFNKRSTTWKELDPADQAKVKDASSAIKVMMQHTSIIKRPVIEKAGKVVAVGFNETELRKIFI